MPVAWRHPKARLRSPGDTWWPAHELAHLLTVPRARIGERLFWMDIDISPFHPYVTTLRLPRDRAELEDKLANRTTRRCAVTAGEFPGAIPFDLSDHA